MIDVFIPPSDFDGDDNHRPVAPVKLGGGQATYNGQVVFTNMWRKDVQDALLPNQTKLDLAVNHGSHRDVHPVFHLHGMQTQTGWIINGQEQPIGSDYGEFMLLVPFVQIPGSSQWFNYVARMYLNDPGAVALGLDFGYRKEFAFVDVRPATFDVTLLTFMPAFHSSHHASTGAQAQQLPNWPAMQSILNMPVLGVDPVTGVRLASYFRLDFTPATVGPVDCAHDYKPAFNPSMPSGMANVQDGAVDVTGVVWQIDFPAILMP